MTLAEPPPPPRPRRRPATAAALAVALLGAVLVALAAVRVSGELTRPPSGAELRRAAAREVAGRWRSWPAGRIFPGRLPYGLDVGGREQARRVGISPDTGCETAVEQPLLPLLAGCRAVVRATYVDQPAGLAITLGVVAFADERASGRAAGRLPRGGRATPGLRALAFPASVVARFGDAARQRGTARHRGPYLVLATIGYADGRPAARTPQRQEDVFAIAPQLADAVLEPLAAPARPDCAAPGWQC